MFDQFFFTEFNELSTIGGKSLPETHWLAVSF